MPHTLRLGARTGLHIRNAAYLLIDGYDLYVETRNNVLCSNCFQTVCNYLFFSKASAKFFKIFISSAILSISWFVWISSALTSRCSATNCWNHSGSLSKLRWLFFDGGGPAAAVGVLVVVWLQLLESVE